MGSYDGDERRPRVVGGDEPRMPAGPTVDTGLQERVPCQGLLEGCPQGGDVQPARESQPEEEFHRVGGSAIEDHVFLEGGEWNRKSHLRVPFTCSITLFARLPSPSRITRETAVAVRGGQA
jgi:hypothetical protein